ncbi:MAG: hypothetical protein ACI8UO_004821 [Verrucomicrobiales bacterium]|jgi:hypothetical protein
MESETQTDPKGRSFGPKPAGAGRRPARFGIKSIIFTAAISSVVSIFLTWVIMPLAHNKPPPIVVAPPTAPDASGPDLFVTHVIIFPQKNIKKTWKAKLRDWAPKMEKHVKDDPDNIELYLKLEDGNSISSVYKSLDYRKVVEHLNAKSDPVVTFLPGTIRLPPHLEDLDDFRALAPFPLVLPVLKEGSIRVDKIQYLLLEDHGFTWVNNLEEVESLPSRVARDSDSGRVFVGEYYFTYVFVNLEAMDSGESGE